METVMPEYPAWTEQSDRQKLEFLHQWLVNSEAKIKDLEGAIGELHAKLRQVEEENDERPM
jgi:hypothetical protein